MDANSSNEAHPTRNGFIVENDKIDNNVYNECVFATDISKSQKISSILVTLCRYPI